MSNAQERYKALKAMHRCTRCGKSDAYTLAGKITCAECSEIANECNARYYSRNRESIAAKARDARKQMRTDGRCVLCGKPNPTGYATCETCRAKRRICRAPVRVIWEEQGVCVRCGKEPAKDGSKLCEACYQKTVKTLEKGRKNAHTKKHPWRKGVSYANESSERY